VSAFSAWLHGAGLVTCLGTDVNAHLRALRAGQPAPARVPKGAAIPGWPYCTTGMDMRAFTETAVAQALDDARLDAGARARLTLMVGSTCLDLPLHESSYVSQAQTGGAVSAFFDPGYGNIAAHLAQRFGIHGPQYTFNTACSSSTNALMHARLLLADGRADHVLVVGVEAYNRLSVRGFESLLLLSRQHLYRPFDGQRDGLILGEGAGALVLGRDPPAGSVPAVALAGAASACDPSSPTGSLPDRMADVMHEALYDAGARLPDLIAIKAHGTGTVSNDLSEGQALRDMPGPLPPVTSLKPYTGHSLGACGAIESLLLIAAWRAGFLPATPGFREADPLIGVQPIKAAQPLPAHGAVLSNSFGFGGNNTALVWRRA
jgi:3-oxoacyl-[acyl-carrier-protein] synthase I